MAQNVILGLEVRDKGSKRITDFTGKVKTLGKTTVDVGNKMEMAFANAVMYKGLGLLTQAIDESLESIREYSKELATFQGLAGLTAEETAEMSKEFRNIANETEFMSGKVAEAATMYKRMGRTQAEILTLLPDTLDLITASGEEVGLVIQSVGSTMKSFGIEAQFSNDVMNQMLATSSNSAQEFGDLAEAIKEVAPVASELGVSFHETLITLGKFADFGMRGTRAGTAMKNMLLNSLKPSGKFKEELKKLNLEGMSFIDFIEKMGKETNVQEALGTMNKRAIAMFEALARSGEEFDDLSKKVQENGNILGEVSEVIRQSIDLQLETTGKLVKDLGVNFFEAFKQITDTDFLEEINNHLQRMNQHLIDNPESIQAVADAFTQAGEAVVFLAKHIDTLLLMFGAVKAFQLGHVIRNSLLIAKTSMVAFNASVVASTGAVGGLSTAFKVLGSSNVIGLVLTGVVTLTAEIWKFEQRVESSSKKFSDWSNMGRKRQREFYNEALASLSAHADGLREVEEQMKQNLFLQSEEFKNIDLLKKQGRPDLAKRHASALADLREEYKKLNQSQNEIKGQNQLFFQQQEALKALKAVVKASGDSWEVFKNQLVFDEKGKLDIVWAEEHFKRMLNLLKETDKLKLEDKTELSFPIGDDAGAGKITKQVEEFGKAINLTKEMRDVLDQTGFSDMFLEYSKVTTISGKSQEEWNKKFDTFLKNFKSTDAKKALKFLEATGKALTKFSGEVAEREGTSAFLSYLDDLDQHLIELAVNTREVDEEFLNFIHVQKMMAQQEAPKAFAFDMSQVQRSLEDIQTPIGAFAVSGSRARKEIDDLGSTLLSLKNLVPEAVFTQMSQDLETFSDEEFASRVDGNLQSVSTIIESTLSGLDLIFDEQEQRMQERHEKQMARLTEEHDLAITLAGDNATRRALIDQEYSKKRNKLEKEHEKQALEQSKRSKAIAMITTAINTATAAMGAAAQTQGEVWVRAAAAASMVALGGVQMGIIAGQKFATGSHGEVRHMPMNGQGNSDGIPAWLSEGEVVTDSRTVSRLGGYEGFSQTVAKAVQGGESTQSVINNYFDTVYGSEEFIRSTYKRLYKEDSAWLT
jgi:TP901 family phage tail tape measure protein